MKHGMSEGEWVMRVAQFKLCKQIETLEEILGRLDEQIGPISFETLRECERVAAAESLLECDYARELPELRRWWAEVSVWRRGVGVN